VARTQAVYYRDKSGVEPADEFINDLPAKRAAKIDAYVEEYLNGLPTRRRPSTRSRLRSRASGGSGLPTLATGSCISGPGTL
jgi:hypothetical protein